MTKYLHSFVIGHNSDSVRLQQLHKLIELGRLNGLRYAASLEARAYSSPNKATQHLAQYALAQALRNLVLTASAKEEVSWEPTTQAKRYWKYFNLETTLDWKNVNQIEEYPFAGHIGSVAFLAVKHTLQIAGLEELIEQLLTLFWQEFGLNLMNSPAARYKAVQTQVGLDKSYIESLAHAALRAYPDYPLFRQKFIGRENLENFSQRVWMGEFSDYALEELEKIQRKANSDPVFQDKYDFPYQLEGTLTSIVSKCLFIGNSAGAAAIHQALIAEAYFNIYKLLRNIDELLTDFAVVEHYETTRYLMAHWYALIADAHSCNAFFHTIANAEEEAKQAEQNCYQWLATTGTVEIDESDDYRLGALF